jgi:hypothetical protein
MYWDSLVRDNTSNSLFVALTAVSISFYRSEVSQEQTLAKSSAMQLKTITLLITPGALGRL